MLDPIDAFTRECLASRIGRRLRLTDVIDVLPGRVIMRGGLDHLRFDKGPEIVATAVRQRIDAVGARTAFIKPGSPWDNGYCQRFNAKLWDALFNGEAPEASLGQGS